VPKNEGQQHLYSPLSGHPRDPPLGHPPRPALRRAPIAPSVGTLSLSVGHPCTLRWVSVRLRQAPVHPLLGTRPGIRLPCSPSKYRGHPGRSIELLRWAIPPDIEFFSSASLLTAIFIHFLEISSTFQKINPPLRNFILCSKSAPTA
jgi:hypothetical protein